MSELAFDTNGDSLTFPAEAEELRVRRFRNPGMRGPCELVHDREGAPLYVPVDTGYLEFRTLVEGVPGRYRLDPVGAERKVISGAVPAYVTISEIRNAASRETTDHDSVIRELARANADMARTMAEKFADVMQAAADLLRAADGAGLTRRAPPPPEPPRNAIPDHEDDDDDDLDGEDDDDAEETPDIASLVAQIMPMLHMWLATRTAPQQAATVGATQAPMPVEPAPVPQAEVAPEGDETGGPRNGRPTWAQQAHLLAIYKQLDRAERRITRAAVRRMPADLGAEWLEELCGVTPGEGVARVRSMIPERRPPCAQSGDVPATGVPPGEGLPTAEQQAHLVDIYNTLEPQEKQVVAAIVGRMTPDLRARWLAEVCALSTPEAVSLVRSVIATQAPSATTGGG